MGRPINKRYLGDVAGAVQVTAYRRATGVEAAGQNDTYIVSQRSTKKFLVADTSSAWSEVLTLVDKNQGTLAAGEFIVSATDAAGVTQHVKRLYNRTVRLSNNVKLPWSLAAAIEGVITAATAANPGVITSIAHGLITGDKISIRDIVGMVELNVQTAFTVTKLTNNTFTVATNTLAYTPYVSGGIWTKASAAGSVVLDVQAV